MTSPRFVSVGASASASDSVCAIAGELVGVNPSKGDGEQSSIGFESDRVGSPPIWDQCQEEAHVQTCSRPGSLALTLALAPTTRRLRRGFTLLEVMLGLALLGLALVVLIKSAAGSIFNAEQAHMLGIATDLGRGEMYEIEEKLLKDGFTDTDQSQTDAKDFADQGWPTVKYTYKVEAVEMPSFDQLTALAAGHGSGAGSALPAGSGFGSAGSNGDPLSGFENSALGGMLNMMGAFGGKKDVMGAQGGALIQTQYTMFQQILKVSVRKVTLKLTYQVLGTDRDLTFVAFFTDAAAMDKVLNGLGSTELPDDSGTGSGAGSGSGKTTPTRGGGSGAGSGK